MKRRPRGVLVIGFFIVLYFGYICYLSLFGGIMAPGFWGDTGRKIGIVTFVLGLLGVTAGVGLLMLWNWARWLVVIAAGLSVLTTIRALVYHLISQGFFATFIGIKLGLSVLFIWYLLRPGVKAQFVKAATSDKQQAT